MQQYKGIALEENIVYLRSWVLTAKKQNRNKPQFVSANKTKQIQKSLISVGPKETRRAQCVHQKTWFEMLKNRFYFLFDSSVTFLLVARPQADIKRRLESVREHFERGEIHLCLCIAGCWPSLVGMTKKSPLHLVTQLCGKRRCENKVHVFPANSTNTMATVSRPLAIWNVG